MVRDQEPKETVSIRISPELKKEFEDFVLDFNTAHFMPGSSAGPPQLTTITQVYRVALEQGLAAMKKSLPKKGGRR